MVSKHEAPPLAGMCMQVYINIQLLHFNLLNYYFFNSPYCRLQFRTRIYVKSIQILSQSIQPPVATIDTIRVQNWHYFENKSVKQSFSLSRLLV